MPAGHAEGPDDDHGGADVVPDPARWDHPIELADIDGLLERSADVGHLDHRALRTWRRDLNLVQESLSYARAVLTGDRAILRRAGGSVVARVVDDLPDLLRSAPGAVVEPEPAGEPDEAEISVDLFTRTDALLAAHQEMAVVDLTSAFDVAGSLAVVEEQLDALTERQEAVAARLQEIRAAVIRHYEEGEATAREQPA